MSNVTNGQCEKERASESRVLSEEAAEEAAALEEQLAGLRQELASNEKESAEAAEALVELKKRAEEVWRCGVLVFCWRFLLVLRDFAWDGTRCVVCPAP